MKLEKQGEPKDLMGRNNNKKAESIEIENKRQYIVSAKKQKLII